MFTDSQEPLPTREAPLASPLSTLSLLCRLSQVLASPSFCVRPCFLVMSKDLPFGFPFARPGLSRAFLILSSSSPVNTLARNRIVHFAPLRLLWFMRIHHCMLILLDLSYYVISSRRTVLNTLALVIHVCYRHLVLASIVLT